MEEDFPEARKTLEDKLFYGLYSQVYLVSGTDDKEEILNSIKNGYLLNDILEFDLQKDSVLIWEVFREEAYNIYRKPRI